VRILATVIILSVLSGCQKMEAGEYGVVFSALPPWLGGGVKESVIEPGEVQITMPWHTVYRVKSSDRSISWGAKGEENYVETRALDGNEVGLAITIQYAVDRKMAPLVVQRIGTEPDAVDRLVAAVARADIRTHMNILRTRDFFSPEKRQAAVSQVKVALQRRLEPEGVIIRDVIYNDHRFERRLESGVIDRSYQDQIERTQAINQEIEQEEKKVATVVEQKKKEANEAQARVNRVVEQVEGHKRQATIRGDAYLEAQKNQAEQVRALGMAEVEGLKKQVEALKGPGGRAILRLEIVKRLLSSDPRFVLLNSKSSGVQVERMDSNELIRQLGVMTGVEKK
jgi:hypothetical protein